MTLNQNHILRYSLNKRVMLGRNKERNGSKRYAPCQCCSHRALIHFYSYCPQGYAADHITSAAFGGKHCLNNLQYLSFERHKEKTKLERKALKYLKLGSNIEKLTKLIINFDLNKYGSGE